MSAPMREIVVDNFAGGGGASNGIHRALGQVDVALNHDDEALAMHLANHPETHHLDRKITSVDPLEVAQGRPIGLAWSPEYQLNHNNFPDELLEVWLAEAGWPGQVVYSDVYSDQAWWCQAHREFNAARRAAWDELAPGVPL